MPDPQPFEKVTKLSRKEIIINNIIGGISWAFGATIGLGIIISLLTFISHKINFVPIVGTFVSDVINFILSNNHNLQK
jgi:Domain of unknown function (DUF5665)